MICRFDVGGRERTCRCHDVRRNDVTSREWLRRRQTGAEDRLSFFDQIEAYQAGLLLEHQRIADRASVAPAFARQNKGRADIGMTGERHLGARRENANLRRMRRILRRQDEGRFRKIELGGDRLHLLGRQPRPLSTTASGLPPNARSVKTSTVMNSSCMGHSISAGRQSKRTAVVLPPR